MPGKRSNEQDCDALYFFWLNCVCCVSQLQGGEGVEPCKCTLVNIPLQDLAVGSDVDGVRVKDPMRTLLPVLLHPYSTHDKIRAVLLYIFSLGGTSTTFYEHSALSLYAVCIFVTS